MSTQALHEVTKYPPGTFSWVDLTTTDQTASKAFYTQLFGWTCNDMPLGNGQHYTMFQLQGKNVAGCGPMQPAQQEQGMPAYWGTYISVDDADATAEKASAAGGVIMVPPFDIFDSGRMGIIQDPTGGVFGLWQPYNHIGASLINVPNTLVWNELMTREVKAAQQFYAAVFGWTTRESDATSGGGVYNVFLNGDREVAGLFEMNEDMSDIPPNWSIYFQVEDFDAGLAKAQSLGGTPLMDPVDSSAGRLVAIRDPQGAVFNIINATFD